MEGAMPNTPWTGKRTKGNLCPGLEARHGRPHRCLPHHLGGDRGDQAQTTTEQQQTLVTEEAAQTEEKTVLPAPHVPRGGQRLHSDFPRTMPRGFGAPVSGLRAAAPGADPPGAGRLPGVPDPLPPGRGGPARVLAGLAGEKKRRAKRLSAAYFLISGVRYWPEGGEVPAGDFVLRDSPPAVCPGAGHHGRLSHRHGDHHGPLPPAVVLGARQEAWDQACKIRTLVEQA